MGGRAGDPLDQFEHGDDIAAVNRTGPVVPLQVDRRTEQRRPSAPVAAFDHFAAMGHAVEERAPSFDAEAYLRAWIAIWVAGADVFVDAIEATTGRRATPDDADVILRPFVMSFRIK